MLVSRGMPVSRAFVQAVVASMERCALYLFRHLKLETANQLALALHDVRHELKLPSPRLPILDCRDWPQDQIAGKCLEPLLSRFSDMERES